MKMLLLEAVPDDERRTVVITTRKVEFPDAMSSRERLEEYYRLLDCRCIDIREVAINGKYFDLIVDDEGLLKDRLIPTFYVEEDDTALFGNILFAHCNDEGETIGLEDSELPMLADYIGENLKSLKNFFCPSAESVEEERFERKEFVVCEFFSFFIRKINQIMKL